MKTFVSQISQDVRRFFSNEKTYAITGRPSLERNPEVLIELAHSIYSYAQDRQGSPVIIDLRQLEFLYPSTLMLIFAIAETLRTQINLQIEVKLNSAIHEFLFQAGFGTIFSLPTYPNNYSSHFLSAKVLALETSNVLTDTNGKAIWFVDRLAEIRPLSNTLESYAIDAIDEVLKNVKQHSGYSTWYGLGQCYPQSNKVRLVFYDNGMGIKSHITQKKYRNTHKAFRAEISATDYKKMTNRSANYAIEKAAIKCVSGTKYVDNSGAGLDFLINSFSREPEDHVAVLSENGLVVWRQGKRVESVALPFKIKGTIVSLTACGLE